MGNINFYQGLTNKLNDKTEKKSDTQRIKEDISELFNMRNLHFLFGSGTSCNAIPNMKMLFEEVSREIKNEGNDHKQASDVAVLNEFESICEGVHSKGNLEEILGILYSHKIYLHAKKRNVEKVSSNSVEDKVVEPNLVQNDICEQLIEIIESKIFERINIDCNVDGKEVLEIYKDFYRKIALRNKDLSRINVFTTNNDLFNEVALDSLNLHYINGFTGGINKFFNPALFNFSFSKRMDTSIEKFEPVENMVYLYKLHGSINWIEDSSNSNTFFNIKEVSDPKRDDRNVLIYPTPMKQNKSIGSPYIDLFREFQRKLLEPHSVLFVIGYSFSDEHVNNIIYQALAANSTFNIVILNDVCDSKISKIDDNRIFKVWGTLEGNESVNIHHFDYIVRNIFPNIDAFKDKDNTLEEFIKQFRNGNR